MDESRVVQVARAIADPTRYRMLQQIRSAGEMTCGELQARFPLAQATISHHVKTLQQAGLLRVRAAGLFRHLSAEPGCVSAFANGLIAKLCGEAGAGARSAGAAAPAAAVRRKPRKTRADKAAASKPR